MKIISYNISECPQWKVDQLLKMEADVYVVPEISSTEHIIIPKGYDFEWIGKRWKYNENYYTRGLGIIWRKGEGIIPLWYNPSLTYGIPLLINNVLIIAMWPTKKTDGTEDRVYPQIAQEVISEYAPHFKGQQVVVIGDFNCYVNQKDKTKKYGDILRINEILEDYGLHSVYHMMKGEAFGEEGTPTYYHCFKAEWPFMLDYAYTNMDVLDFQVLPWDKNLSDHVGLVLEVKPTAAKEWNHPLDEFTYFYERVQAAAKNMPCHFNALECVGLDENANSRVLQGMFMQHLNGNYEVLKSFVTRFLSQELSEKIDRPLIVTEQLVRDDKRIDILIYEEGKYAIIMENKFNEAPEQPNQLANYIEGVREMGFTDEQIYIVYLPWANYSGPTETSWNTESEGKRVSYKEPFKNRYAKVSFREELLDWLKSKSLETIRNSYFQESLKTYIDFLETKIRKKGADTMEQAAKSQYISQRLHLQDNALEDTKTLFKKINEIDALRSDLIRLKKQYTKQLMGEWSVQIASMYPRYEVLPYYVDKTKKDNVGIKLPFEGIEGALRVCLWIDTTNVCLYVAPNEGFAKIKEKVQTSLADFVKEEKGFKKGNEWAYYKSVTPDNAIENLQRLVNKILEISS